MSQQYVVTAEKATSVSKSLVCRFTGPHDLNLVIAKGSRLEIRQVTPDGLQHRIDVPIYGAIATMESYRVMDEECDRLFVLTERYQFCVIQFDAEKHVRDRLLFLLKNLRWTALVPIVCEGHRLTRDVHVLRIADISRL